MSHEVIIVLHKSIIAHSRHSLTMLQRYTPSAFGRTLCPAKYNPGCTFANLPRNCQMPDCYWER